MEWVLLLMVWNSNGQIERYEPTPIDWHTCRMSEMRFAAGLHGTIGQDEHIAGVACVRKPVPLVEASRCELGRACG
jgi:hypothetical protein